MGGIILDRELSQVLMNSSLTGTKSLGLNTLPLNEALFALLMYDKIWLSSSLKALINTEVGKVLSYEEMVAPIPEEYVLRSNEIVFRGIEGHSNSILSNAPRDNSDFLDMEKVLEYDRSKYEFLSLKRHMQYYGPIVYGLSNLSEHYPTVESYIKNGAGGPPLNSYLLTAITDSSVLESIASRDEIFRMYSEFAVGDLDEVVMSHIQGHYTKEQEYDKILELIEEYENDGNAFLRYKTKNIAMKKYRELSLDSNLKMFKEDLEHLTDLGEFVLADELLSFSSATGCPLKTNIPMYNEGLPVPTVNSEEYSYRVFQIVLEEVETIPKMESVYTVLKNRNDQRVQNFRDAIMEWTLCLTGDNPKSEQQLRYSIGSASRDLSSLGEYHRVKGWVTTLSIPGTILDSFTKFPFASIALGGLGYGFGKIASNLENRTKWLLFGSGK